MNREDIIRMARGTCSQAPREDLETTAWVFGIEGLESFAALVAAAEREACAEECVKLALGGGFAADCAAAIRARGQ